MDDLSNMHGFHKVLGCKYAYVFFLSIIYDFKYACFVPPVNQETLFQHEPSVLTTGYPLKS